MTTPILDRIKNRKFGFDEELEQFDTISLDVSATLVTKIELFKKEAVADSGRNEVVAKYFKEQDAYLITVSNWDLVEDKDTCLREKIVPLLTDRFKLSPAGHVVFQFLDCNGNAMRHVPSPGPKLMKRD